MSSKNTAFRIGAAPVDDRDFVVSRVIDAPRELVFRAWTESKHFAVWWGPKNNTKPECTVDARVGGQYRIVMKGPDGKDYPMGGEFVEVVAPERLEMTMDVSEHPPEWHELLVPGHAENDPNPVGIMLMRVTFDDVGGKTNLTVRVRLKTAELRKRLGKFGMQEGWKQSLDKLEQEAHQVAPETDLVSIYGRETLPNDQEIVQTRVFDSPRELVFRAWSELAHIQKWWGPLGFRTTTQAFEFKVGGVWRFCMHGPDGRDYENKITYLEIVRPERIVYKHGGADDLEPVNHQTTVTFEDLGTQTKVVMRARFVSKNARDYVAKIYGAIEGGRQHLGRLAEYLKSV